MFRRTNPQRSMFESEFLMPAAKTERLKKSWAEAFRTRVMPLIDEEAFRDAFSSETGRPNKSIRLLVGLHLLKEWNNLTDEQVLEQLEYNLQWHYALGVEPAQAHTCQKTLHNFRVILGENERAQEVFVRVTRGLAEADGVRTSLQRLDSTQIISNIAVLTRLGLFVETVTVFLKALRKEMPDAFSGLEAGYARRYLDREGYFADAKSSQTRRRLKVVARDAFALAKRFETHGEVSELAPYAILRRLVDEQCELVDDDGDSPDDDDDGGDDEALDGGVPRVKLREPKEISGSSLQTPHDPDATYGHKGKGYQVQIAETCHDENPYQLVTGAAVEAANASDQHAVRPMLDQLDAADMAPDKVLADTNYGSGANIVECAQRDIDLHAPVQDPHAPPKPDRFCAPTGVEADNCADDDEDEAPMDLGAFAFDTTCHEVLSCPGGKTPLRQYLTTSGLLIATFAAAGCEGCPFADDCPTRLLANGDRQLRRKPASIATELRQVEQQQRHFKEPYKKRSGIESTNRELKYRHGLAKPRVRGRGKVELAVRLKLLALNVKRAIQHHVEIMKQSKPGRATAA